jgi:hypothetical protein
MPIDPQELANLDPEDGSSHVDAIRELAVAIQELQSTLLILQADVDDLSSAVRELEDKSSAQ